MIERKLRPRNVSKYLRGFESCVLRTRCYSVIAETHYEETYIPVGVSGRINLRIHNPKPTTTGQLGPVIIHLANTTTEPTPRALLTKQATLVTVLPRWTQHERYPTPLHDTTIAYEWICKNICTQPLTYPRYTSKHSSRTIAVYATSHLSSIALSLSLTECRSTDVHRIAALALRDGIFDFSILARQLCPPKADAKTAAFYKDFRPLFSNPEATFDPYVSPNFWFLSPGIHMPSLWPGEEEKTNRSQSRNLGGALGLGGFSEYDDDPFAHEWDSSNMSDSSPGKTTTEADLSTPAPKSSYLTFQTKGSPLKLPYTRFAVSETQISHPVSTTSEALKTKKRMKKPKFQDGVWEDLRAQQALEMARLMRRSVSMHECKDIIGSEGDGGAEEGLRRVDLLGLESEVEDLDGEWALEWFDSNL